MADQPEAVDRGVQWRYWQEFLDLKRDALYIQLYYGKTEKIDRYIRSISAIASSSAIAGWVIWRESVTVCGMVVELSLIWAIIVMASHVLTAVKEYLPYNKRLNALSVASNDLGSLTISMESNWFNVSGGMLTEEEINELHMKIKQQKYGMTVKSFGNISLPHNSKFVERADLATKEYVKSFYGSNHG